MTALCPEGKDLALVKLHYKIMELKINKKQQQQKKQVFNGSLNSTTQRLHYNHNKNVTLPFRNWKSNLFQEKTTL